MEKYQQIFISNLKYFRLLRNLSQAKFAELCNVSTGTIGNIECGLAKPSFDLLIQMAAVLQTEPYILLKHPESVETPDYILREHNALSEIKAIIRNL